MFGLYFGQLKNHSTLLRECGGGGKTQIQSRKTIRSANLTQRMAWVPNYSDTPTVILVIFNVQSIDRSIYIYNTISCLSLFRKNNTSKLTKKKVICNILSNRFFSTWFLPHEANHVAVASLTRCLVAEFVGNRKVMSLKMSTAKLPNPGETPIFRSCGLVGTICGGNISENVQGINLQPWLWIRNSEDLNSWFHFIPLMSGQF